ncbi:hypothetical protein B0T11DRAFT_24189 [Plectosphaerella cucumerina]|uniref:Zn(2)-C6 fungal-type domain-containing protein n=1 Tax=Plectosphaerella cucumerina TaxID=40658 RepID=A0A8K0TSS1_9PEZI|nr:hypothetical protein B0T11DRAFT_24189 [Plectosphaerella cucumerina]
MRSSQIARSPGDAAAGTREVLPEAEGQSQTPTASARRSPEGGGGGARAGIACFTCRSKKVKCSGQQPCSYCDKRNLECVFRAAQKRKLFEVSQVQDLEDQVALFRGERTSPNVGRAVASPGNTLRPGRSETALRGPSLNARAGHTRGAFSQASASPYGSTSSALPTIAASHALSSTRNFGVEVQRLLDPQAETSPSTRLAPHLDVSDLSSVCSPEGVARPAASLLPSEEDARSCLEAVAFHLGESQHYIDLRIFSDTLDNIYEGGQSAHGVAPLAPLQLVEVMLVLALGKQILRMELPGEMFPGEGLFKGAITRLPPFSEMKRIGIPMVSILALAAIYFQNLDMPEDAHFYSSTALRIVLMNKMHRRASSAGLPRSRRLHLNRLWWTVYMQERRLAVSTGSTIAIQDSDTDQEPPFDSHGFVSSRAMTINVRIARISGNILSCKLTFSLRFFPSGLAKLTRLSSTWTALYLKEPETQDELIESVRGVIRALYETARDFPPELSISFAKSPLQLTRTSASLYLMLYLAMMYAIRPILLHLAKARMANQESPELRPESQLHKLAGTCIEAAQRSISILEALQKQGVLGVFPFGDLDTLFSSTFVLVLSRIVGVETDKAAARAIKTGCEILKNMERRGNATAGQRRGDIVRINQKLGCLFSSHERGQAVAEPTSNPEARGSEEGGAEPMDADAQSGVAHEANEEALQQDPREEDGLWSYGDGELQGLTAWPGGPDPLMMSNTIVGTQDLAEDPGLLAMYCDQDMRLSGVDYLDWGELERCVEQAQNDLRHAESGQ